MAEFLKDTQLVLEIEKMIENTDDFLWLISPYIKLHDRVKTLLRQLGNYKPWAQVVVIFGKNEEDVNKSISKEDVAFLKELPNITIGYEKRLHAKFYASEDFSIITSMNLHQFSSNNNIECGIKLRSNKWFGQSDDKSEQHAFDYFSDVIDNSKIIFEKKATIKQGLLGLKKELSHTDITIDDTDNFFKQPEYIPKQIYKREVQVYKREVKVLTRKSEITGYCIRTGIPIPYNIENPMCKEALEEWSKWKNPNYKEKYCHKTGKESFGKTSMRNPIL